MSTAVYCDVDAVFRPALPDAQLRTQQRASQEAQTVEEAKEERQQRAAEVRTNYRPMQTV